VLSSARFNPKFFGRRAGLHRDLPRWEAALSAEYGGVMREVEVKYRVSDLEALLVALKGRGIELSESVYQDDQAYAPVGWEFGDSKLGVSFVRLRTVGGRHYFALTEIEMLGSLSGWSRSARLRDRRGARV
jgi:hypothetical protein